VVEVTSYTAVCRRSGDWWAISVPEIKGVHTQARRLDQAEDMAREAIALMLDVVPDSFDVDLRPEVPDEVTVALNARQEAERAEERANRVTRDAITSLLARGLTVRDAGSLLHLSPQRVSQIAQPNPKSRRFVAKPAVKSGRAKPRKNANQVA
jgi:predicted RNase H-like HicB family nuclease